MTTPDQGEAPQRGVLVKAGWKAGARTLVGFRGDSHAHWRGWQDAVATDRSQRLLDNPWHVGVAVELLRFCLKFGVKTSPGKRQREAEDASGHKSLDSAIFSMPKSPPYP